MSGNTNTGPPFGTFPHHWLLFAGNDISDNVWMFLDVMACSRGFINIIRRAVSGFHESPGVGATETVGDILHPLMTFIFWFSQIEISTNARTMRSDMINPALF